METKECRTCKTTLPVVNFYVNKTTGFEGTCKRCDKIRHQISYQKRPEAHRAHWLKVKYNITEEKYNQMLANQNGLCAICKGNDLSGRRLAVDHDHDSGVIRGLLCLKCNRGLGCFEDSDDFLKNAAEYIRRNKLKAVKES